MRTSLTERLDIRYPILLAPMNGCAGGALAAAVSQAGGLGLLGGGIGDVDWLQTELARAGEGRVGVGFITWYLAERPEALTVALDHGPAAIMLANGDHKPFVESIKAAAVPLICQVQTLAQAKNAAETGADVIVIQGQEAGGHGMGVRSTMALAPAVVDVVDNAVPVVAAGGIADGRGLAAALSLGCGGVLMGTRFAATPESLWSAEKKTALVAAKAENTIRTKVFDILRRGEPWPDPYDARGLRNEYTDRWHGAETELLKSLSAERARYKAAEARGELAGSAIWAGEGVDLINGVHPAGDIVAQIVADAAAIMARSES